MNFFPHMDLKLKMLHIVAVNRIHKNKMFIVVSTCNIIAIIPENLVMLIKKLIHWGQLPYSHNDNLGKNTGKFILAASLTPIN